MYSTTIDLVEKFVPGDTKILVARAVILAQDIKEESWSGKIYRKDNLISAAESVKEVGLEEFWINIISMWNHSNWNGIQEWAQQY